MGVKPTVVSIKRHFALVKELNEARETIKDYKRQYEEMKKEINGLERALDDGFMRDELRWFAWQCEKSLAYHDPVKGDSWKKKQKEPEYFGFLIAGKMQSIISALTGHVGDKRNGVIIRLAVGIANLCMMMAHNAAVEDGQVIDPPY